MEANVLVMRYTIAVLKGDQGQMDRIVALAKGKHGTEHRVAHAEALALARSGRLQAARQSSSRAIELALQEGRREEAASYRAAEQCGKPFTGIRPKEERARWRRWSSQRAATSNTPPALPWVFRETFLDRRRSPPIWKRASRKIRS